MIRCQHCGGDVEEGRSFCPHCGKPATPAATPEEPAEGGPLRAVMPEHRAAGGRSDESLDEEAAAAGSSTSFSRSGVDAADGSRRTIFIVVGIITLLMLGGLFWWASRPATQVGERSLEGAIRPGSAEFEEASRQVVVDFEPDEDATIGVNSLGNAVVTMRPTVRNLSNRTVSGLEFRAAGLDINGGVIRERTEVREQEIEPFKTTVIPISVNFPESNQPAQLKLELTGVRFK